MRRKSHPASFSPRKKKERRLGLFGWVENSWAGWTYQPSRSAAQFQPNGWWISLASPFRPPLCNHHSPAVRRRPGARRAPWRRQRAWCRASRREEAATVARIEPAASALGRAPTTTRRTPWPSPRTSWTATARRCPRPSCSSHRAAAPGTKPRNKKSDFMTRPCAASSGDVGRGDAGRRGGDGDVPGRRGCAADV